MPLFNAHHYNVIAKEIRELWEVEKPADSDYVRGFVKSNNNTLSNLVLNLCKRFAKDNPAFDSMRFIGAAIPADVKVKLIEDAMNG